MRTKEEILTVIEESKTKQAKVLGNVTGNSPRDFFIMRETLKWVLSEQPKKEKKIKCACGDFETDSWLKWFVHIFSLGCYTEDLIFKADVKK